MLNRLAQSAVIAGLASGLAIAPPAQAQIVVTGGNISFRGTQIYVPNTGFTDIPANIYNGSAAILVRTPNISINDNVLLRGGILPNLSTCPCTVPQVGDTGTWKTALSFVAYSNAGEPTVFRNIPATLDFRIDGLLPTGPATAINRFESPLVLLSESGVAVNSSSFGGVTRITPVRFVEFSRTPSPELQAFGIANVTPGINYPGDINASITGGIVSAPLANSFTASPPPALGAPNNGNNGSFFATSTTYIESFNSITSVFSVYGLSNQGGTNDPNNQPPNTTPEGNTKPNQTPEGNTKPEENGKKDDGETIFVDQRNNIRYVIVGLPSRVFPGMIGVEGIDESKRTAQVPTPEKTTEKPVLTGNQETNQTVTRSLPVVQTTNNAEATP